MIMTSLGRAALADTGDASFLYLGIGSGTQAEAETITHLANQITRVALTNKTVSGGVITGEVYIDPGATPRSITEWGIFSDASGDTCLIYDGLPTPQAQAVDQPLIATWTHTVT